MWTLGSGTSIRFLQVVEMSSSSNELHSSSVVGSVVNERGVKVFDDVVGSVTKEHFGVLRSSLQGGVWRPFHRFSC